ncbi:hypothetical protein EV201_0306 [Ancylomarina subtilis]|uniref:DinB family protein n=1 Tax=Ancylomarina subtilis TaxID=1639035 RepID=A0A4Q7VHU8_9BACT|nr:hypothetical protein [Ancylomarina subtilis]RZT95682.1 hypothetical protein EV201_0306 [Ancylomarina subtilis]
MQIINASKEICGQLFHLCENLKRDEYSNCSSLLLGSSIGKHMRHIIEFFDILREGSEVGEINYDTRVRSGQIENDPLVAKDRLALIIAWLEELSVNKNLSLYLNFDQDSRAVKQVKSNLMRELAYNLEHAIHHMALIRIALNQQFPDVRVDANFGVAYSTIRYNKDQCAH